MRRLLAATIVSCTIAAGPCLAQTGATGHRGHLGHLLYGPIHGGPLATGQVDRGPTYTTLQGAHRGSAAPVPVRPYAYGWFGAQPRYHCVRHFGYYRNYTQWTAR